MIPESAALIVDFVNTYDVESGHDDLDVRAGLVEPAALTDWLAAHRLRHSATTDAELDDARTLRESLRALLRANHDGGTTTRDGLDELAARLPLRVRFDSGTPELIAAADGTAGGLAQVLAACVRSASDGTWSRLKVCGEQTCQWAFYDLTRNHSRAWCSMRVCGNRSKTRTYRERQRTD